jgi:hypothetical protein
VNPFTDLIFGHAVSTSPARDELMLQSVDGKLYRFCLSGWRFPEIVSGQTATVVLSGQAVCSVQNHATGEAAYFRFTEPFGPYREVGGGCLTLALIALLFLGCGLIAIGVTPGMSGLGSQLMTVGSVVCVLAVMGLRGRAVRTHETLAQNAALDQRLEQIMAISGQRKTFDVIYSL